MHVQKSCMDDFIEILIAKLTIASFSEEESEEVQFDESNVLVLDGSNITKAIEEHKFLLVEFYAPWCGHCKRLAPIYAEAASILAAIEPRVHLAKIDATENQAVAQAYEIQGYPTLKWFENGNVTVCLPSYL